MPAPTYRLRFFFDYDCGGCLWGDNDASYQKFGGGVLDAEIYDSEGNVSQEAKIKLPPLIRQKTLALDDLYGESLNWDDPGGDSRWDQQQWESFYALTRALHEHISQLLGDDFEVVYQQEVRAK